MTTVEPGEWLVVPTSSRLDSQVAGVALAVAVLSAVAVFAVMGIDSKSVLPVYLTGFGVVLTVGLGAGFCLLMHHLTRARWSTHIVGPLGAIASLVLWCVPLFIPIALGMEELLASGLGDHGAVAVVPARTGYHSVPFVIGRGAAYLLSWSAVVIAFREPSRSFSSGRPRGIRSERLERASGPALVVWGITLTLAGLDWFSCAAPRWYSAALGVHLFAGAMTSAVALLALLVLVVSPRGSRGVTLTLRHDVGKLLFGFTVFWAYIAFMEYLVAWYAGRPAEAEFLRTRSSGVWADVTVALVLLHFVLPAAILLSKAGKRSGLGLGIASVMLLVAHGLDVAWLVMPGRSPASPCATWGVIALAVVCVALVLRTAIRSVPRKTDSGFRRERLPGEAPIQGSTPEGSRPCPQSP